MYGTQQHGQSQQQSHGADEQHRLLPSYSPAGARLELASDGAHLASAWPATFETGVETIMASPAAIRRTHSGSFSEHSRILQPREDELTAIHGGNDAAHGKMNYKEAVFNAINVLLGVGVLSSPFALRSSGLLIGVPLFFFFTFVTNHTGKLLGYCLDYQEGMQTYPDIGEAAFGTRGRLVISVIFFSELFTACAMFNVLIGDTLAALLPSFTEQQLTVLAFLLIMPTLWTTHLSLLSYFSIIGILSSLFCLYTLYYVGFAIDTTAAGYTIGSLLSPQPLEIVADTERMPLAIGLTMVAFGGHSVFPSICSSMADRTEYPKVLNVAYFIVCLVYGAIELGGYLMFGVHTTKEITLNLIAVFPGSLTRLVIWTIALNPMSKIAITITPIALALEEFVLTPAEMSAPSSRRTKVFRAFLRTVIGVATLFCALFVPHFARVTSFLGAFFAMLASVFLPCVCYIKLFGHRLPRWEIWLNAGLAGLSLVFAVVGTIGSFVSPADLTDRALLDGAACEGLVSKRMPLMRGGNRDEALGSARSPSSHYFGPEQHAASPQDHQHTYSVPTLDELIEKSRHDAIVNLQRWWRRRHGNQKRVTEFHELIRSHAEVLINTKRSARIRAKIRELLLHAAFLYFYTTSTQADLSGERLFHLANAPVAQYLNAEFSGATTSSAQELKSFSRIANIPELFAWLRGPFLALSYQNSERENDLVFQSNRVVGGIRIGQLRVLKANCSSRVTTFFASALTSDPSSSSLYCYGSGNGAFQSQDESSEPFGGQDGTAFEFAGHNGTSTLTERKKRFSSMASATSGSNSLLAPAFSVVLPRADALQASQILQWLDNDNYIDSSTRALMLDVNLYNVMLQYVLALRFVFEFPSGGGVVPRLVTSTAPVTKSFLYDSDKLWKSVCSLVVLAFYVYFLFSELLAHTGRRRKAAAFKALQWSSRFGSGARVLSLVFYLLVWLMRLLALINFPGTFPLEADTFVSLRAFTEAFRIAQHLLAVNTCLCWLVLLLLLRVSKNVDVFVRTVLIARTKLLSLLLCMALLLYGSASAFVVALGSQVRGYESVSAAIKTLSGIAFGLGGVTDIVSSYSETGDGGEARPYQDATITTVLLAGFLLLNGVVVANLFLVVIYESYRKAVEELEFQQQQSSHKRVHLVIEIAKYAKALYEQLTSALRAFYDTLHCAHRAKKKLVSRTSRMSVVRAISSSKAMQKSARLISSHVGALSDFGGKLVHNVVSSERDDDDEDDTDVRDTNSSNGNTRGRAATGERGLLLSSSGGDGALGRRRGALLAHSAPGGGGGADTKLLQGMILQLALQNENLIRSIEEIRGDVKSLAALNTMDDASRRRLMSPASQSSRLNGGSGRSQHSRRQSTAQQQQHFHPQTPPQVVIEDRVEVLEHLS